MVNGPVVFLPYVIIKSFWGGVEHGFILQNHKGALLKVRFAVNQPLPNTAGYTYRGNNSIYR